MRRLLPVAGVAVTLVVTGCTDSSTPGDASRRKPAPSSSAPPSSGQPDEDQVPVAEPPELDGSERMAGRQPETRGNAGFSYAKGAAGDALIVAVRCRGAGTMKVEVKTVKVSFPLECLADETTTTYNQVGVSGVEKPGTVNVTAPSGVHWSMTIGRGEPQHHTSKYLNNRAENSHQPTRRRERAMKRFTPPGHAQRSLSAFSGVSPRFRPRRHRPAAAQYRTETNQRFTAWRQATGATAAA